MKKALFLFLFFLLMGGFLAAEINLGAFPLGTWLDDTYEAYWEFTTGNIRILDAAGNVYYDFGDKTLKDFKVGASGGAQLSFSCVETGKRYTFTKPLTNSSMKLEIEKPDKPLYSVDMAKQ